MEQQQRCRTGVMKFSCKVGLKSLYGHGLMGQFGAEMIRDQEEFERKEVEWYKAQGLVGEEIEKERYVQHILYHDRRRRFCKVGCLKHMITKIQCRDHTPDYIAKIRAMSIKELEEEILRIKSYEKTKRQYDRKGYFKSFGKSVERTPIDFRKKSNRKPSLKFDPNDTSKLGRPSLDPGKIAMDL